MKDKSVGFVYNDVWDDVCFVVVHGCGGGKGRRSEVGKCASKKA